MIKNKKILGIIIRAIGLVALIVTHPINAATYNFSYTGVFTVLDQTGNYVINSDVPSNSWNGTRTDISGNFTFNDATGVSTSTINSFMLFGAPISFSTANSIAIGDGIGSPGNLLVSTMTFDYDTNIGVPLDIVYDATGLFNALQFGMSVGDVISGDQLLDSMSNVLVGSLGSVLPASDGVTLGPLSLQIGPTPVAATTWNVSNPGNLNAIYPLTADTIGGSTQLSGLFTGLSLNLDIGDAGSMYLESIVPSPVPVPASIWLLLSGLGVLALKLNVKRVV
ncbi:hypothetical protein MNBD_GAMMA05-1052 [hydrothermal vent metagenome]|uniref:Uncharacterized protein n=1 Tax=hydrothermal vent metagenome TaxID=652676 RepID=A0A3B0W5J8_9ZZZZ